MESTLVRGSRPAQILGAGLAALAEVLRSSKFEGLVALNSEFLEPEKQAVTARIAAQQAVRGATTAYLWAPPAAASPDT